MSVLTLAQRAESPDHLHASLLRSSRATLPAMKQRSILAILIVVLGAMPSRAELTLDANLGVDIPFDSELRDVYGTGFSGGLGVSAVLTPGVRVFLDAGILRTSGQELAEDPTFLVDDARFVIVPVILGLRRDVVTDAEAPLRFHIGVGWQTVFSFWRDSFGETERDPTLGIVGELRPELLLNDQWSVWVRQRVSLLGEFVSSDGTERNMSSSSFEFGVSYRP